MNRRLKYVPMLCVCLIGMLVSCGTVKRASGLSGNKAVVEEKDPLTPEQRRKYDYFFLEALRMKEKGDLDAAFEMYSHCLDIYPQGAATLFEISRFHMFLNQPEKGEEALKKAVDADPKSFWYKQTLAAYYQGKGNYPKAIYVYEDMASQFPSRLEPLMALIDLYTRTKDYQQVVNTLNRLEALDGKSEQISMEKFRMYLAMNNDQQAFTEIENLAKEYPYDMRYLTILGDVYLNNGKEEEAYETYQKVLKEEPGYAPALLSMASYYEKKGQDSLYQVQLDTILLNDNVDSDTKMNIMRQLILRSEQTNKDSTKIAGLFTSILKEKQENADIAMLAAQYLLTKKMDKEATPVLHQVLEIDPENTPARLQLLSFAIREQNMDEVIKLCAPALEYTPDVLEFYHIWRERYQIKGYKAATAAIYGLAGIRIVLCMMPQNAWLSADSPLSWGIYRNIPFALMGLIIIVLFYKSAKENNDSSFRWMWLTIVLSFAFYIPVVLLADVIPMIGMLMIPKTCAYVWTVLIGYKAMKKEIA